MLLNEAKRKLINMGYRIIKESTSYEDIISVLEEDGYTDEMIADVMDKYDSDIQESLDNGDSAFEIAAMIEGFEENNSDDDITDEIEIGGDNFENCIDPDEYMEESKSNKQKTDKFERKSKLAGKKKSCCGKNNCKDCDDELDEAYSDAELEFDDDDDALDNKARSIADLSNHSLKTNYKINKGDGRRMVGAINRLAKQGITRKYKEQEGTDDWSDFRDDFRAQTLILKKTLTPKFISDLIKDKDFEIDSKDIKDVALKMLKDVKDTKNPVEKLQSSICKYFTK